MSLIPRRYAKKIPSFGDPNSSMCLIGEAPELAELNSGKPFIGAAGDALTQCLRGAKLIKSDCFVTNVFKFRIKKTANKNKYMNIKGDILWTNTKGFTPLGMESVKILLKELKDTNCSVYVPLGNVALDAMLGYKGITKYRGSVYRDREDRLCVPTIHPSATLRGNYFAKYYIMYDLMKAARVGRKDRWAPVPQRFYIDPSLGDSLNWLDFFIKEGLKGKRINYDIELLNGEISCISYAMDMYEAVSIPYNHKRFNAMEEAQLWLKTAELISHPGIKKVNQNIMFDAFELMRYKIISRGGFDDPMTAHSIMFPDFPKGLGFLISIYTDFPFHKDDGKNWGKYPSELRSFWRYNCQDSCGSVECMNQLDKAMDNPKDKGEYRDTYRRTIELFQPLLAMELRGMKAEHEPLQIAKKELQGKREVTQAALDEAVGHPLNVSSHKQMCQYFYEDRNIHPYVNKGRPTCDDKAMSKLAVGTKNRAGIPEARLVQELRKYRKLLETYMEIEFDPDQRIRCSYNPRGATTGRLSSSQTLRGTGANMQNIPEMFRQFLVSDDQYVLVEFDVGGAEWVIVAYVAGDAQMLRVVKEGIDPHAYTGHLMTNVPMDIIKKEATILGHETDPERIEIMRKEFVPDIIGHGDFLPRSMTVRQCGKKANHGGNYGIKYRRFANANEIPEHEAQLILNKYHGVYPGIENNFHAGIQHELSMNNGTITNCFGRKRRFYGRMDVDTYNQAYDFKAQSTVADLINNAMVDIYHDVSDIMVPLELLAQIHDSILTQYPLRKGRDLLQLAKAIIKCKEYMSPTLSYGGRDFILGVDCKVGFNWRDMVEVKIEETPERLAGRLYGVLKGLGAATKLPHLDWD